MFQRAQQLIDVASQHQKAELVTLHNAVLERMKAYQTASTAANKRDWDAAKKGLQECIDQLWPVYFPEQAAADPEIFEQQKAALNWLHNHFGKPYPSAGKFSQDIRAGLCIQQQNKTILRKDLKKYADVIGHDKRAAATGEERARHREDTEIAILEEKLRAAQLSNRKEDAKWVLKEDAEIETAALIGLLQDTLSHRAHLDQGKLLHACGGDTARAAEFSQALEDMHAAAFNELADGKRFEISIEEEED